MFEKEEKRKKLRTKRKREETKMFGLWICFILYLK